MHKAVVQDEKGSNIKVWANLSMSYIWTQVETMEALGTGPLTRSQWLHDWKSNRFPGNGSLRRNVMLRMEKSTNPMYVRD